MLSNIRSRGAEPSGQLTSVPGLPSQGSCRALLCALHAVPGLQEQHHRGADKLPKIGVTAFTPSGAGFCHSSAQLCKAWGCSHHGGGWRGWLIPWVSWGRKNQHQQGPRHARKWQVPQGTTEMHMLSPGPILPTFTSTEAKSCWYTPCASVYPIHPLVSTHALSECVNRAPLSSTAFLWCSCLTLLLLTSLGLVQDGGNS